MTPQEIFNKLQDTSLKEDISMEDEGCYFSRSFTIDYENGEESGDAAWSIICEVCEEIEPLGLRLESDSDNDTVWGKIIERNVN